MELYLIRHADALALGERGITDDAERPLSEKGEEEARAVGAALARKGIVLDRLYTSPLLRARQTAEAILKAWSRPAMDLQTCAQLVPGVNPRRLARFLEKDGGAKVGLVGHMPHLARVIGWLIGKKKAQLDLAKAGVAYVSCNEGMSKGDGVLHWMVAPDWY